jgi:hypothetical protein
MNRYWSAAITVKSAAKNSRALRIDRVGDTVQFLHAFVIEPGAQARSRFVT